MKEIEMENPTTARKALAISIADAALEPWPIAVDQILVGQPEAAGRILWLSDDKKLGNGVWSCTPGSFVWNYTWDETFVVTTGRAQLHFEDGTEREVGPGDLVFVPTGVRAEWKVSESFRKAFHLRSDEALPF